MASCSRLAAQVLRVDAELFADGADSKFGGIVHFEMPYAIHLLYHD